MTIWFRRKLRTSTQRVPAPFPVEDYVPARQRVYGKAPVDPVVGKWITFGLILPVLLPVYLTLWWCQTKYIGNAHFFGFLCWIWKNRRTL